MDSGFPSIVKKKLNALVGFHNFPNQVHKKSIKNGFTFNILVVGDPGLGKSTLINTLFHQQVAPPKEPHSDQQFDITTTTSIIEESQIKLSLTIISTPFFATSINNIHSFKPILHEIESRFDAYYDQETKVNRKKINDCRVHACIYFVPPTGHGLRPIDIDFMKRVGGKVNLIVVLAKSDLLTDDEMKAFKAQVLEDIKNNGIEIYYPPTHINDDPESAAEIKSITSKIPFAVIGSEKEYEVPGKKEKVRGRMGLVQVDNEDHCDFVKLRQMLIRTHMEELKEHTHDVLYENYRLTKISEGDLNPGKYEEERTLHEARISKMEQEMKLVFQQKVAEKASKLEQSEKELYARHRDMKEQLEKQRLELEEKKKKLLAGGASPAVKAKPKTFFAGNSK